MIQTARAPARPANNGAAQRPAKTFTRSRGVSRAAHRVVIYGTGGIGKTSLAAMAPDPIFADLERGSQDFDVERAGGIETWADLRDWLHEADFAGVKSIVIDTATAAEELCRQHIIGNVRTEKGNVVTSLEGFGYGKGYVHLFEEWKRFLGDLEKHYLDGRNVVLLCHEQIGKVPNPTGEDYIRYQPRLYHGPQASLLHPTKEWADHVLFVSYDVSASDGKAKGSGSRTIYSTEAATHMAKTRTLPGEPILFPKGSDDLWRKIQGTAAQDEVPL